MTPSGFDLLVVGEINPDLILRGADLTPAFGQVEKLVENATLTIGSSSVMAACGAARLGLRTAFIGVVGDDVFGHFMVDAMRLRGIDTSGCIVDAATQTGFSVILSQPADRAILTYSGSIAKLRLSDIDINTLGRARHLHVGSFFLLDALRPDLAKLFGRAKAQGLSTSLDTNWDPSGRWNDSLDEIWPVCDVFLPNEAEACHIARTARLEDALDALAQRIPTIAVKAGAKGGILRRGNETATAPPLSVDVVDTTGAGDSFNAGFLFAHLNSWTPADAIRLACACGSLSTRGAGGTEFQPTLLEAQEAILKGTARAADAEATWRQSV